MKHYNFELARRIIDKLVSLDVLETATLGMHEDWFWTAEEIWSEGKYKKDIILNNEDFIRVHTEYIDKRKSGMSMLSNEFNDYLPILIGGIAGSDWATPTLQVELKDGTTKNFNCYLLDNEQEEDVLRKIEKEMFWTGGCLSGPAQAARQDIEIEDFKE